MFEVLINWLLPQIKFLGYHPQEDDASSCLSSRDIRTSNQHTGTMNNVVQTKIALGPSGSPKHLP